MALQGEFQVHFHFMETVVLKPGYVQKPNKDSGALEMVLVVEDSPTKIVLQHLLVVGQDQVIKHWREDWNFEASERFEFVSDQSWRVKPIKKELVSGHWTQCVFEVSDAPRYCGTGKFNHKYGVSTWTSDRTWRPLPRRDYTVREDYNAINAENRITVTPSGWTHEQDNTKTVRNGEVTHEILVREFGFNDYRSIQGADFTAAYRQWEQTKVFWARVRAQWQAQLMTEGVHLRAGVRDTALMEALDQLSKKEETVAESEIASLLRAHVLAPKAGAQISQTQELSAREP